MLEWLAYGLPWPIWVILAVAVLIAVYLHFGLRSALVGAAMAAAAIFGARARQQGWKDREAEIERERLDAIRKRRASDAEVDRMDDARRNAEWDRWLRNE